VTVQIRRARLEDVPTIVELIANDQLGARRESPGDPRYEAAFAEIDKDPNQLLAVVDQAGSTSGSASRPATSG
jgi:hypothetical protein